VAPQAKQEKNATKTGTLLAALADALHNVQSLRAPNLSQVSFEYIHIRKSLHARGEEYVHPHLNHL